METATIHTTHDGDTGPTRRGAMKQLLAGGLAMAGLAMSETAGATDLLPQPNRGKRIDPPAAVKVLVLAMTALVEAEALHDAHGPDCDCGPCHTADDAKWTLAMLRDCLSCCAHEPPSDWLDEHGRIVEKGDSERASVVAVRDFLTMRLGDSTEPANTPQNDLADRKASRPADWREPPAAKKLVVVLEAAAEEASELAKAHGGECECDLCGDCCGARPVLTNFANMAQSEMFFTDAEWETEVLALRRFLTGRFGQSSYAGTE